MADWIKLRGSQIDALRDALCQDFDPASLSRLLDFRLRRKLANTVGSDAFEAMVSRLIERAGREIWLDELILAAYQERPENAELVRLTDELGLRSRRAVPQPDVGGSGGEVEGTA